ncbi:flagellar biosynthetic protein FliQ [Acidithiobacillus ferriphilus]|uniref:flagellar biosynthetic protein FliQ n=2 Tax=Acidithiobacillus ferriphilus TaxID=1689834 RepID=UPI002DBE1DF5|nr:flagellar biosynthetic protein FliQ [Acidithiobacillus ferriphilus]
MTTDMITKLLRQDLWYAMIAFLPVGLATVVVGLLVTILQAWLHWNDVSLSFVPKIIVTGIIFIFGWWIFVSAFTQWFEQLAQAVPLWLQH